MTSIAVTIAGSDSGGGAGIQADLKTFSALGVYGASVITALTAQNTLGVHGIHTVPADFVSVQMDAVFSDLSVGSVKVGMLSQADVIDVVVEGLEKHNAKNIVLDPVMVATSGDPLLDQDAVSGLVTRLFPKASLVTPNLQEAAYLLKDAVATGEAEMERQAEALLTLGAQAVLLKGGHGTGDEAADLYLAPDKRIWFRAPRIATDNTHGTGCTLSSAIAAGLAKEWPLRIAIENAKSYVTSAIEGARELTIGEGSGPTHHFHALWGREAW
ncbi:MAG: bifunctional hydroxymethylpyrimidine kinase/phosphomethylpyrimidine kinase [Pseudomonadota bacterium]